MATIEKDRGKVSTFVKCGYIQISGSKKSLKILVDDPAKAFVETYYVSIADIQKVLSQPSFSAQIVRVERLENSEDTD